MAAQVRTNQVNQTLPLPQKKNMKRLSAAIILGAAQAGSIANEDEMSPNAQNLSIRCHSLVLASCGCTLSIMSSNS